MALLRHVRQTQMQPSNELTHAEREWGIKVYGYGNGPIRTQSRASRQAVAERHTVV